MNKTGSALTACCGLMGAAGVALGALGAHHNAEPNLALASQYLLIHAAAALGAAAAAAAGGRAAAWLAFVGAWALASGATLFGADLAMRALAQHALAPMAAPAGGLLLILGWLILAAAGLAGLVQRNMAD